MPAPDPDALYFEEYEDGSWRLTAEVWPDGNRRHRLARMGAVIRRLRWGGWKCVGCADPVPLFKRADARYCSERCRKADARALRRNRRGL